MNVAARMYGQFLVNTPANAHVAGTFFADTAAGFSHDRVSQFLSHSKLTPWIIWEKFLVEMPLSRQGFFFDF